MKVAGVDGTKAGWVVAVWCDGELSAFGSSTFTACLSALGEARTVAVDMPIGFTETAETGGRVCERIARSLMPGRASSVFSSPVRCALEARDYPAANAANRHSSPSNIGLSKQSFALFPKMREIDRLLTAELQERVVEVHPELCFATLSRQLGIEARMGAKKAIAGGLQRIRMLQDVGFDPEPLLASRSQLKAGDDDIIDACVAAWTAWRHARGVAMRVPETPPRDRRGLAMEMWA